MFEDIKWIWKYVLLFIIAYVFGFLGCLQFQAMSRRADEQNSSVCGLKWKQGHFILSRENLASELTALGCSDVRKAYDDAMAGSDSLRSVSCTQMHNVFGLRDENGRYLRYQHWTESVAAYLEQTSKQE